MSRKAKYNYKCKKVAYKTEKDALNAMAIFNEENYGSSSYSVYPCKDVTSGVHWHLTSGRSHIEKMFGD